jgi:hypothetical protein
MFCVALQFFSFILALWLLRHRLRHFVDHYPYIICHIVWKGGNSAIDLNHVIPTSALITASTKFFGTRERVTFAHLPDYIDSRLQTQIPLEKKSEIRLGMNMNVDGCSPGLETQCRKNSVPMIRRWGTSAGCVTTNH